MRAADALAGIVVALAALPPAAHAQGIVALNCRADRVLRPEIATAGLPASHPAVFREIAAERVFRGEWSDAAALLLGSLDAAADSAPPPQREVLRRNIAAMRTQFGRVESSGELEAIRATGAGVSLNRFDPFVEGEEAEFFPDSDTPMLVDASMDASAIRTLCWHAISADWLLLSYGDDARARAASSLKAAVRMWDSFNARGYSQYPWEVAINGRGVRGDDWLKPPSRQIVLLHPSIGIEAAGTTLKRLRRHDVVMVEPLGLLFYRADRSSYFGASAVVSLPSDADAGIGVLLHAGPAVKLGWVWRSQDAGGSGAIVSVDLFQWLSNAPAEFRDAKDRVQTLLLGTLSSGG